MNLLRSHLPAFIAAAARAHYRGLVYDTPGFVDYFRAATPIDVIERLRIGSRPSKRGNAGGVSSLRAIPWVFAWSQNRCGLTAWLGVGTGLAAGVQKYGHAAVAEMALGSTTPGDAPAEEAALVAALDAAEPKAKAAVEAEDFTGAMAALALLRAPIDVFFDKVTVNDADGAVRARRLNLLARFRDAVHQVADFSKIEG